MADLLGILSVLLEFLLFVVVATLIGCIPLALFLWGGEVAARLRAHRHGRRLPVTKVA